MFQNYFVTFAGKIKSMLAFLQNIIGWYMLNINYLTIFLLMAVEGSFIPFPSEVVVPPAAWKAAQGELNLALVVVMATLGALVGSIINYYLAYFLGRKLVYSFAETKMAKILLINREKVEKAEIYFVKHGKSSTFIGRLIPGVRQLISIPAGLARMPIRDFILFTTLGAGIWNVVLAALGYFLYSQKEVLELYYHELSYAMLGLGVIFVLYLVYTNKKKKSKIEGNKLDME
jgi:membrane protein DedA with SNARE-associated domain